VPASSTLTSSPTPCRLSSTGSGHTSTRRQHEHRDGAADQGRDAGPDAVADMATSERKLQATRTARAVRVARADARAADLAPLIAELRAAGVTTLQGIADGLNRSGIPTPRGRGEWQAPQVRRVLARLA
jgi:hypothetical protein